MALPPPWERRYVTTAPPGAGMDPLELVKQYGPWSLGWVLFVFLLKWVLDRFDKQTEAIVKTAVTLETLTNFLKDRDRDHG